MDRWYAQFTLFNDIHAKGSSYVCRVRDNSRYEVVETRPLSSEALAAGVLFDEIVELGLGTSAAKRPDHPVRLVQVAVTPTKPHGKTRGGKTGPPSDEILRIATNLLDVPAKVIAEIYRQR
jgi:hypothetical protein